MITRLVASSFGEPSDVLSVGTFPDDPPPGPGRVRVAVAAVGLNFLDVSLCRGDYPVRPDFPMTPGVEASGVVVEVGATPGHGAPAGSLPPSPLPGSASHLAPGSGSDVAPGSVADLAPGSAASLAPGSAVNLAPGFTANLPPDISLLLGQRVVVCPALPHGALGTTVTIDADLVVPLPDGLDLVTAAALPVTYQTAWFALERARVTAGETVLVHAGAGGVGIAVTQLVRARGARVLATAGSGEKLDVCRAQGASEAFPYEGFEAHVRQATGGRGADVVVDPVGLLERSLDCLAFEGRLVTVGFAGGDAAAVHPGRLIGANADLIGVSWGSRYPWARPDAVRAAYRELFRLCATGAVRPPVTRVVPLAGAPEALSDLAARRTTGKIVVGLEEAS